LVVGFFALLTVGNKITVVEFVRACISIVKVGAELGIDRGASVVVIEVAGIVVVVAVMIRIEIIMVRIEIVVVRIEIVLVRMELVRIEIVLVRIEIVGIIEIRKGIRVIIVIIEIGVLWVGSR
jgi:hypothetical protein